jgi:hypothetical protein
MFHFLKKKHFIYFAFVVFFLFLTFISSEGGGVRLERSFAAELRTSIKGTKPKWSISKYVREGWEDFKVRHSLISHRFLYFTKEVASKSVLWFCQNGVC